MGSQSSFFEREEAGSMLASRAANLLRALRARGDSVSSIDHLRVDASGQFTATVTMAVGGSKPVRGRFEVATPIRLDPL